MVSLMLDVLLGVCVCVCVCVCFQLSGSQLERFCPPGGIWQSLGTFLVVAVARGRESGYWHLIADNGAEQPTMHRTAPTLQQTSCAQNVESA